MKKIYNISRELLFHSCQRNQFSKWITVIADIKEYHSDIDVIISSHKQHEAINLTIENYSILELKSKLHFYIVETYPGFSNYIRMENQSNISRIQILTPILSINRYFGGSLYASNSAALATQIGCQFSKAQYVFACHNDTMGYKRNFLTYLLSKLNHEVMIASFTQRHLLPFTGCILYNKAFLDTLSVDWLPKKHNSYRIKEMESFRQRINHLNWIDAGEQLIFETLKREKFAYVCSSRGLSKDFFGHPLEYYDIPDDAVKKLGDRIKYASLCLTRDEFRKRYPELSRNDFKWRKCFDDAGDVVFIHRGRGTSSKGKDLRGDFQRFVRDFNHSMYGL